MISWWASGEFFVIWVQVGLWGGIFFAAFPWVCEIVYIFSEWPIRQSNSAWKYIFWSAEFWMLFMQGGFWLVSMLIHLICVDSAIKSTRARQALDAGFEGGECQCDPCTLPDDEVERAQAEAICKAACTNKCPPEAPPCPLKQFEDESIDDYTRRCKAAAQLA